MSALPIMQIVTAVELASTVVGAVGSFAARRSQSAETDNRAALLRQQAEQERQLAEQEAEQTQRRDSARLAAFRARLAGSGLAMHGTPLLVDEVAAEEAALNAETVRQGGEARALRLEQAADLELARARDRAARASAQAGTSLLSDLLTAGRQASALTRRRSPLVTGADSWF
jgi:hypothetical protein